MSNFFASTTNPSSAIGVWTTRAPMFGKAPTWAPRCPLGLQKGTGANRRKISVLTFKDDTIFYIWVRVALQTCWILRFPWCISHSVFSIKPPSLLNAYISIFQAQSKLQWLTVERTPPPRISLRRLQGYFLTLYSCFHLGINWNSLESPFKSVFPNPKWFNGLIQVRIRESFATSGSLMSVF